MTESLHSWKMLVWKDVKDVDPSIMETLSDSIVINGGTYCRKHLRSSCHVCEIEYAHLHDEANQKRIAAGAREVGDKALNAVSVELWAEVNAAKIEFREKQKPYASTGSWCPGLLEYAKANEARINAKYAVPPECSQCAYFRCGKSGMLERCSRCHIVKYCSRDCQKADWKWEHKIECKPPISTSGAAMISETKEVDAISATPKKVE